jgi:hypothetical protein
MVTLEGRPMSYILTLHVEEKEDKGGPIQLLSPIAKSHDWLERGSRSGKRKEIRLYLTRTTIGPPLKGCFLTPYRSPCLNPQLAITDVDPSPPG